MDTEKCAALLKVLELGSLSAAAQALGYTPSGVSRMMVSLEQEAGFPLLLRAHGGVSPTAECEALLPTVRALAHLGEQFSEQAAALRGLETGTVRVGCAYGAYYDRLAQTIAAFGAAHPGIEVEFLQDSSSRLCEAIERQEADCCLVSFREGDFDFLPLRSDPLMAWVPANHPRVTSGFYPMGHFAHDAYIDTYPGRDTDNARAFQQLGITPNTRYTTIDTHATASLVAAGLGVSLNNSVLAYGHDLRGVVVLPAAPEYTVSIGIASVRRERLSPAAKRFLEFAAAQLADE